MLVSKDKTGVDISTRDRVLRAWENSMELTRDFQRYSREVEDEHAASMFADFAEEEGTHASKLRDMLTEYDNQ